LLRVASPGISDLYQGSELWNLSLVDPDNRGDVDFNARRHALSLVRERLTTRKIDDLTITVGDDKLNSELLGRYHDGWVKLYALHLSLLLRKELRELFLFGDYQPLLAGEHLFAFTRAFEGQRIVCAVPRFSLKRTRGEKPFAIGEVWQDDALSGIPEGRYLNVFDNRTIEITATGTLAASQLFRSFPLSLLLRLPENAGHDAPE
jgi:(1->4)-alpha-D-glucan 1-alpha-D-glucosylmutase